LQTGKRKGGKKAKGKGRGKRKNPLIYVLPVIFPSIIVA